MRSGMPFRVPALLSLSITAAIAAASAAAQTQQPDGSTVTFPRDYFVEYAPVTANDMLNRIPGIDLILGTTSSSSSNASNDRGLGSSSQILIDGKRLTGKANEASSHLDLIAANGVDYHEIIRRSSDDPDVPNTGAT